MVLGDFRNNTVVENSSSNGSIAGVRVVGGGTIENNIVAHNFSTSPNSGTKGIGCGSFEGINAVIRCNDIWGQDIDDVAGCTESTVIDNISANPLFCDNTTFDISHLSPCAPSASTCGLMGARNPECVVTGIKAAEWSVVKELYR
jgi:hypothetical protein